jgi:hypothetical protein
MRLRKDHFSNVGQVDLQVACSLLNAAHAQALGYESQSRTLELSRGLPCVTTAIGGGIVRIRNLMRGSHSLKECQNLIDIWQYGRRVGLFSRPHNSLSSFPFVGCGWIEPPGSEPRRK